MAMHLTRRGCLRILLGAVAGATLAPETTTALVRPFDTFIWRKVGDPFCSGGILYETWFYSDCYGTICEQLWCENRQIGTC